uniref:HMG box domain-containing protein n=1 Tax=Globodera pallida TaxID=36090 RepID=A0A183CGI1_GLOPA
MFQPYLGFGSPSVSSAHHNGTGGGGIGGFPSNTPSTSSDSAGTVVAEQHQNGGGCVGGGGRSSSGSSSGCHRLVIRDPFDHDEDEQQQQQQQHNQQQQHLLNNFAMPSSWFATSTPCRPPPLDGRTWMEQVRANGGGEQRPLAPAPGNGEPVAALPQYAFHMTPMQRQRLEAMYPPGTFPSTYFRTAPMPPLGLTQLARRSWPDAVGETQLARRTLARRSWPDAVGSDAVGPKTQLARRSWPALRRKFRQENPNRQHFAYKPYLGFGSPSVSSAHHNGTGGGGIGGFPSNTPSTSSDSAGTVVAEQHQNGGGCVGGGGRSSSGSSSGCHRLVIRDPFDDDEDEQQQQQQQHNQQQQHLLNNFAMPSSWFATSTPCRPPLLDGRTWMEQVRANGGGEQRPLVPAPGNGAPVAAFPQYAFHMTPMQRQSLEAMYPPGTFPSTYFRTAPMPPLGLTLLA